MDAELHVCRECGHLQMQGMDDGFLASLYAQDTFNIEDPAAQDRRHGLIRERCGDSFFAGKRVLEIGGGRNSFVATLTGCERWVSDFSVEPHVRDMVDHVVEGDFLTADLPLAAFDVILVFHCIEHFGRPGEAVACMAALLKPGGSLVAEVPNIHHVAENMPFYGLFHMHASMFHRLTLDALCGRYGLSPSAHLRDDSVLLSVYGKLGMRRAPESAEIGLQLARRLRARLVAMQDRASRLELGLPADQVGLYGAGGSATLFLANTRPLDRGIGVAFDRDERKWGRTIPGTEILIQSVEKLATRPPRCLLVMFASHAQGLDLTGVERVVALEDLWAGQAAGRAG